MHRTWFERLGMEYLGDKNKRWHFPLPSGAVVQNYFSMLPANALPSIFNAIITARTYSNLSNA